MHAMPALPQTELLVRSVEDSGSGSLREAILTANNTSDEVIIRFDPERFSEPATLILQSSLPVIERTLEIDGYIPNRLWQASGVSIDGQEQYRAFQVKNSANVTLRHLTLRRCTANKGGAIHNAGILVVYGMTLLDNRAGTGGAIASVSGSLQLINSTLAGNIATGDGGALAIIGGKANLTNSTLSDNAAKNGGAVYNDGQLLLRNSILANSKNSVDCVSRRNPLPNSRSNIVESNHGCGRPFSNEDPGLRELGYYNGPTPTIPLSGSSPAINVGDNSSALNEYGEPLQWDQRGNGDPRFAMGITDIGAFEYQSVAVLEVDTLEDIDVRRCTRASRDCSLRGALTIANASDRHNSITFDHALFKDSTVLKPASALPTILADLSLSAGGSRSLKIGGPFGSISVLNGVNLTLSGITLEQEGR